MSIEQIRRLKLFKKLEHNPSLSNHTAHDTRRKMRTDLSTEDGSRFTLNKNVFCIIFAEKVYA
jgi:hypothetical protein